MKAKHPSINKQGGFTLLESLIALFVLTIGILGVAGLQMQGMRAGNVAKQRMLAVSYSEELLERIRANPAGVDNYAGASKSYACSAGQICGPDTMAADDLFIWNAGLINAMPGEPTADITVLPVNNITLDPGNVGRIINIDISWVDRGDTYTFNSSSLVNKGR